jgi:hypothetical protein
VVQRLLPAPGGGDGYLYIILNLVLADEVVEEPGAEAGIQGYVLGVGLAGNDALYFDLPPC